MWAAGSPGGPTSACKSARQACTMRLELYHLTVGAAVYWCSVVGSAPVCDISIPNWSDSLNPGCPASHPASSCCAWEGSEWWPKCVDPCHPYATRLELLPPDLVLGSSPGCCSHLGHEPADRTLCLPLFFYCSAFEINR